MESARTIGVAMDFSTSSRDALSWAINNLVRDGDSIILLIVQPKGSEPAPHVKTLWLDSGSPLIPFFEFKDPKTQRDYGITPELDVITLLQSLDLHKDVTIHIKIYWGDPSEKICDAISKIPLNSLVMGSRGRGLIKRALLGSVSNYVVNNAPCPVTIVKQQ